MKISPYVFPGKKDLTAEDAVEMVCELFGVTKQQLRSPSRSKGFNGKKLRTPPPDVVTPRQVISYLARYGTSSPDKEIAGLINRHRTVVISSAAVIADRLAVDHELRSRVAPLFSRFKVKMPDPVGRADWK